MKLLCSIYECSVAEPSHFSSAPAPDIVFLLRLQVKHFGSGFTYESSAPTSSGSCSGSKKLIDFDTKHLKNLNLINKSSNNLDCVPKRKKTLKNRFNQSQKMYLVLYLTVGQCRWSRQVLFIIQKYVQCTMKNEHL